MPGRAHNTSAGVEGAGRTEDLVVARRSLAVVADKTLFEGGFFFVCLLWVVVVVQKSNCDASVDVELSVEWWLVKRCSQPQNKAVFV